MAGSKQSKKLNSAITQELMGDVERVEFMLMSYWKVLVLALALVVIVIVAGFWGCSSYRASQHRAAVALADAATAEELRAALEAYPSAPGASLARYRLATLLIDAKDYDAALAELQLISGEENNPELAAQAALNEAYLYELSGKSDQAAKVFSELGTRMGFPELLRAEANFNAARLYAVAGDLTSAVAALKRIPQSSGSQSALWSQHGEALLIAIENNEYGPYTAAGGK